MTEGAGLLRNPVLEREFFRFCRMRKWFVIRTGLVAALTLVVWFFFAQGGSEIASGNLDAVGRVLFAAACFTQVLFLVVVAPGLCADLVAGERRTGNLEVMLSTPLSPLSIVVGKLVSRVSLLLVVVASAFPAVAVTLLFGGVRAEQVAALFLTSAGLVFLFSAPALLLSSLTDKTAIAAAVAYLAAIVAALILVAPVPGPGAVAGSLYRLAVPPPGVPFSPLPHGALVLAAGLLATMVSIPLVLARLRFDRAGRARPAVTGRRRIIRGGRAYDLHNPLLAWEARRVLGPAGMGPFWTVLGILLLIEAIALFLPTSIALPGGPVRHAVVVTAESFVILLFTTLAGSTSVITDREQGTIELLRMTDLTPREVVQGKAIGTALAAVPLGIVPLVHLIATAALRPATFLAVPLYLVLMGLAVALCASDGVMNSIHARSVARAVLRSMWHFSWLTAFLPVLQVFLPMLFFGTISAPEGPTFSLLYPLFHSAALTVGMERSPLDVFGFVFWLFLMGILAAALFALLSKGRFGAQPRVRRNRPATLSDWRESWARLTAQWDEDE
ncbi:MAG: ABC transporter permease subunit [Planctomycetota bacterium]